jgi:pyruvate,water dikinase
MVLGVLAASLRSIRTILAAARPLRSRRALEARERAIKARTPVSRMSDRELLRELRLLELPAAGAIRRGLHMTGAAGLVWFPAKWIFRHAPEVERLLTAGMEGNPTTEISLAVDGLVERAGPVREVFAKDFDTPALLAALRRGAAGRAWLRDLEEFLDAFGHRGPREFDHAAPRWSDDPTMILELVRAGLRNPGRETVARRQRRLKAERRAAVARAVAAAPFWKRPLMRALARWVLLYMPLREAPKHAAMQIYMRSRLAVGELGRRLAERSVIQRPEDVWYLEMGELEGPLAGVPSENLGDRIQERRSAMEDFRRARLPAFLRSDGVPVVEVFDALTEQDGTLRGEGVYGASAQGPVRVLKEPDPTAMADGDVLVMEFADPGWTPLFPRAAAIVMEVGGGLCHAAVVARELGIPSVFGVHKATERLCDGQVVEVDGRAGTVRPLGLDRDEGCPP